ncbi:CHASE domain-containing protein [Variovorax sp. LjRoot290]|uniref:CHASE domain-containing protein n=1 Tax=Variovorax sp. LjRoot290 TaxID=3342316 RepID=UPI003ECC1AC6
MNRPFRVRVLLTGAVLALGLFLTFAAARLQQQNIDAATRAKFERQVELVEAEIERRFRQPVHGLNGARGIFAVNPAVSRNAFRAYVNSRNLQEEFPGVRGFGFAQRVSRDDLPDFVAAERRDEAPHFTVRTVGNAPDLYVIKFLEPVAISQPALGYDIGSESTRRQAIERAVSTGSPTLSGRIFLQSERQRPGFLYMTPVYRSGKDPGVMQQRQAELLGLLFSPIVAEDLLAGSAGGSDRQIDFSLYDGDAEPGNLLFASKSLAGTPGGSTLHADESTSRKAVQEMTARLPIGGRQLTLRVNTTPAFEHDLDRWIPTSLRVGGVLVSLLLALTMWLLATGRARAYALAQAMTTDLERLAAVVRHTSNLVVITDRDCKIQWFNDAFASFYGYTFEDARGQTPLQLLGSGRTDPETYAVMNRAAEAQTSCRVEVVNRSKDGTHHAIELEVQPRHDAQGRLTGFMEIGLDVTTRKHAEEQLRRNHAMLKSIMENLPCGLSVFDGQLHLAASNQQFRELLDLPDELFSGRSVRFEDVVRNNAARGEYGPGPVEDIVAGMLERAQYPTRMVFERERHDGKPLEVRSAPMPGGGFVTTYMDISERKKIERMQHEFISTVSHELRTPLTAIYGSLSLLGSETAGPLPPDVQELVAVAHKSCERLMRLISDVLDVERIQAGLMHYAKSRQALAPLVDQAVGAMRAYADQFHVSLEFESRLDNLYVEVDPDRIVQVLVNLISNAVKFSKPNHPVSVRMSMVDGQIRVCVSDQGIGIPAEFRPRIFDRFAQADGSDRRAQGGTGLGLNICKSIVEAHGGRIDYISTVGVGTEFFFDLPGVSGP